MAIKTFQNITVNSLSSLTIIAGTYRELNFYIYDENDDILIPSTGATLSWSLAPYEQSDYILFTKQGVFVDDRFVIYLLSTDTENLSGKFIQSPLLDSGLGMYVYPLGRGLIDIIPRIGMSYYG